MAEKHPGLVVSFFGWSDSGKTTLIVELAAEARRRGLSCAAAKCSLHPGDFEQAGKDSSRYAEAGASPVAYVGLGQGGRSALFLPTPERPDRAWLERLFPEADLILVEGLEVEGGLRVLVDRSQGEPKRKPGDFDILVAGDGELREACAAAGIACYGHGEAAALLGALEERWKGMWT